MTPQFEGQLPSWEALIDLGSSVHIHSRKHNSTPDQSSISLILLIICKEHLQRKVGYNCCVLPSHTSRGGKFVALASVVAPTSSRQTVEDVTLLISVAVIRCDKNIFRSDQI